MHNIPNCERVSTRPLRENRCDIDYSVLNDGYDVETNSPKRRRRHSSRPRCEPTAPRKAAQKKIVETKINLSSQYENLDLEKIMDSHDPALQLVPLSGVTNSTIDKKRPSDEEYVTPVLGTIMVHGITEKKLDFDNENPDIDLEEMAMTENKTETTETRSEPDSTIELQDVTNIPQSLINETTDPALPITETVEINSTPMNPTQTSDADNSSELKGVTPTDDIPLATYEETETEEINGITMTPTQNIPEQNEPETLPDLVLNENIVVNEVNTTEDADEAAEALLQLSKLDILPEDDTELPLGVLPVDTAPVPITLGNQDVLNTIENLKQTNCETGIGSNSSNDPKTPEDVKLNNNKKDAKIKDKKNNTYKARHAHKRLYTVLPKYSKIQVLPGITSCRLVKDNKQAIELNSLLINNMPKDGY